MVQGSTGVITQFFKILSVQIHESFKQVDQKTHAGDIWIRSVTNLG